jgi:hypothetical protein
MPNGDPNWHVTELPKLERFFAPLAEEIRQFASAHNMSIERYYHEAPDWRLQFTPPQGGNATIDIRRIDDETFTLTQCWFVDDYDASTRSLRWGKSPTFRVKDVRLTDLLRQALIEMLSWPKNEWTQVATGYEQMWHRYTREQFENMSPHWPKVRPPGDAG